MCNYVPCSKSCNNTDNCEDNYKRCYHGVYSLCLVTYQTIRQITAAETIKVTIKGDIRMVSLVEKTLKLSLNTRRKGLRFRLLK
jgi:hypothetical protein